MKKKVWLILDDNSKYAGYSFGVDAEVSGEVVFSTNMTGFQELLSDANYREQIVVSTFSEVGIAGMNPEDIESGSSPAALVCREFCPEPSNFRAKSSVEDFMKERGIVGIYGVDTREITRKLRDSDTLRGIITSDENASVPSANIVQIAINVQDEYEIENPKYNLALINFGIKQPIIDLLNQKGCSLTMDFNNCDGVVLSDGAANPSDFKIETIKRFVELKKPILAFGLGHQMLAIELGCEATKLENGHRGSNQPVRDLRNGNIYITRQNHGYTVKSVPEDVGEVILENVNDKTIEGIKYKKTPAISIQFEPSKHGGPRSTDYLIDEFLNILGGEN